MSKFDAAYEWRWRLEVLILHPETYAPLEGAEIRIFDLDTNKELRPYFGLRTTALAGVPFKTGMYGVATCYVENPRVKYVVTHPNTKTFERAVVLAAHPDDPRLMVHPLAPE